jgi:uncharacterized protein (TIGR04255 family)
MLFVAILAQSSSSATFVLLGGNDVSNIVDDEFDIPFGGIPTSGRIVLPGNKIVVANAEARFLRDQPGISDSQASELWELLGGKELFPFFEQNEQKHVNFNITDDGVEQSQGTNKVWLLSNTDRTLTVMIMPTAINVQVLKYARFGESLAEPFAKALGAYANVTKSSIVQRIGLRYINRVRDAAATRPTFWADNVRVAFAGPIEGVLGNFVTGAHQQVQLRLEPTVGAVVHSGVFEDAEMGGTYSCLVDIDVFSERALNFDSTDCANLTRKLNRTAYALFAQTLAPEFIDQMGSQEQGPKEGEDS